jgi:hypothetical protein
MTLLDVWIVDVALPSIESIGGDDTWSAKASAAAL